MSDHAVQIVAPSRLHFGLFSFGQAAGRRFGGVGAMVEKPGIRVNIEPAERFLASGQQAERVLAFAERWKLFHDVPDLPKCHIHVDHASRQHVGLGVGTQLALSVAAGLTAFCKLPMPSAAELAISVGRGLRSAVGTYGFAEGGFIVEGGKHEHEVISPLDCRLDIPSSWRFVMICPQQGEGLFGPAEHTAFKGLGTVDSRTSRRLQQEVRERMTPAMIQSQFDEFSESLYRFGHLAGSCFAHQQGGPFNGPQVTELVQRIQSMGVRGVGQSSWGPTVFALLPNMQQAARLARQLSAVYGRDQFDIWTSGPSNHGATVNVSVCQG